MNARALSSGIMDGKGDAEKIAERSSSSSRRPSSDVLLRVRTFFKENGISESVAVPCPMAVSVVSPLCELNKPSTSRNLGNEEADELAKPTERSLISYGGMDLFDDAYDNSKEKESPKRRRTNEERMAKKSRYRHEVDPPANVSFDSDGSSLSIDEKRNFDFSFDSKRDSRLVASKANRTFANDSEIMKYWHQRHRLFSRINRNILMDREGWFSVTPEQIAKHIAEKVVQHEGGIVVDAFAGVGGNAIQFALKGAHVIAIDNDPMRLRCALQNAQVYGVRDRIDFICEDFFHFVNRFESSRGSAVDVVFLSPPWGGPSYSHLEVFDLKKDLSPDGFAIFESARKLTSNIVFFLPKQVDTEQVKSLAIDGNCYVERSYLKHKVKTITAYFGDLCRK